MTKAKVGAPTIFSKELADLICERMITKRSLLKVCDDEDIPSYSTVNIWLNKYTEFHSNYVRAREEAYERYADDIFTLCNGLLDGPTRKEVCNDLMDMFKDAADSGNLPHKKTVDDMLRNVVTHEKVSAVKLMVDSIKWTLSKILPRKYSDKVELEHTGSVEINKITRSVIDPLTINQSMPERISDNT